MCDEGCSVDNSHNHDSHGHDHDGHNHDHGDKSIWSLFIPPSSVLFFLLLR